MLHSLYFDMQHDYFQKKNVLTFDITPGVVGECKDRICICMVLYAPFSSSALCSICHPRGRGCV